MSRARPRLVGVIHLPALPGSPRAARPLAEIVESAAADASALAAAGFDLVMIENFGDVPFFAGPVPRITVTAMTACAVAARGAARGVPLGVNVLRNDADAALAIAVACDAACIRVNVHTGARVTDQGLVQGDAAATLRRRRDLGADRVEIWADVDVKHSAALAPRPVADEAQDLVHRGLADAVLVTGAGTGRAVDLEKLREVRRAVPDTSILVASGATIESLGSLTTLADGVIVGSALREGGRAGGPIVPARAAAFATAFRGAFGAAS